MTSQHLLSLADRVEVLDGPDSDVDRAVLAALGYTWRGMAYWFHDDSHTWMYPTNFTGSLDAAATLVPAGYAWCVFSDSFAGVAPADEDDVPDASQCGATPALALCAASLRARAASKDSQNG